MNLHVPVAAVLLAAAAGLGRLSDARRATPPPKVGAATVLGGFSALAAQVLWIRADRALLERREDDAILALRGVVELEPQLVSAAQHAADTIGWDLSRDRPDAVRWAMAQEGLRILDDAVADNPASADALRERGRYALLRLAEDPALAAGFRRDRSADGPVAAARADLRAAAALAPRDLLTLDAWALAGLREGVERVAEGRFRDAVAALDDAAAGYARCRAILQAELSERELRRDPTFGALARTESLARDLRAVAAGPDEGREAALAALVERYPELGP